MKPTEFIRKLDDFGLFDKMKEAGMFNVDTKFDDLLEKARHIENSNAKNWVVCGGPLVERIESLDDET